jgi:hypothetical protein
VTHAPLAARLLRSRRTPLAERYKSRLSSRHERAWHERANRSKGLDDDDLVNNNRSTPLLPDRPIHPVTIELEQQD